MQGSNLIITTDGDDIFVNDAKIIQSDYLVVNGVIHVIDRLGSSHKIKSEDTTNTM